MVAVVVDVPEGWTALHGADQCDLRVVSVCFLVWPAVLSCPAFVYRTPGHGDGNDVCVLVVGDGELL